MNQQREVVVITGASGGIGRATARKFGAEGAKVALIARGRTGLEAAGREVEQAGGTAMTLPVDVAQYEQVEAAATSGHGGGDASRKRRQVYVGIPTVMNIFGERVAPWLLDRYLARSGLKSQMADQALDPQGHDNLFEPVDEDRGAHGPFDDQAHAVSPHYELAKHRGMMLAGLGAAAAGAGVAAMRAGRE